jgi:hypothetical protein
VNVVVTKILHQPLQQNERNTLPSPKAARVTPGYISSPPQLPQPPSSSTMMLLLHL